MKFVDDDDDDDTLNLLRNFIFITARLHVMQRTVLQRPFCPSVRSYVCLSNACFVTKRKKLVPTFLYYMKDYSS